jgi:hypothetical protein
VKEVKDAKSGSEVKIRSEVKEAEAGSGVKTRRKKGNRRKTMAWMVQSDGHTQ